MSETLDISNYELFKFNNNSFKYQRLTQSGCKDKAIWKSEFVAKTQFLCPEKQSNFVQKKRNFES